MGCTELNIIAVRTESLVLPLNVILYAAGTPSYTTNILDGHLLLPLGVDQGL